jgi:uncharacterized membrane protein YeaQ/YmgE (transglycosylase-associated protein family)
MEHAIGFIVIGLVVGALYIRKSRALGAIIRVVGALVGSLAGGFISRGDFGSSTTAGKYGSFVVALAAAIVVGAVAVLISNSSLAGGNR